MAEGRSADGRALRAEGADSASVSLTFYFETVPSPVPDFLANRRLRNPRVPAFGFSYVAEQPSYGPRMSEINGFVDECVSNIPVEVNAQWLAERACRLRLYISVHPGPENGAVRLSNETLNQLAAIGATIELDVI